MHKITIPQPCHEKWSDMTPQGQGAFCGQCSKVVVDFTKMSDVDIQNYFIRHAHEKLCGRFKTEQVDNIKIEIPSYIISKEPSFLRKFILVSLVVFGSTLYSCTNSEGRITAGTEFVINSKDTIPKRTHTIGKIAAPVDTIKKSCKNPENEIMGDIALLPADTTATITGISVAEKDTTNKTRNTKQQASTKKHVMGKPAPAPKKSPK